MSDTPRSAADKAMGFLFISDSLAGSPRTYSRAMLIDNGERGSAQKAATFDADDLSALMQDFAALERELAEARKHDVRNLCMTEAASFSPRIADYAKHWEGRTEKAERELAEARADLARISEEYGLPPTIGPSPGEIKRREQLLRNYQKQVEALRADLDDMMRQRDQWKEFAYKHPEVTPPVVTQELAALRAEVEAAARWCFVAGKAAGKTEADFRDGEDFFTAWSRYQQEKARREP